MVTSRACCRSSGEGDSERCKAVAPEARPHTASKAGCHQGASRLLRSSTPAPQAWRRWPSPGPQLMHGQQRRRTATHEVPPTGQTYQQGTPQDDRTNQQLTAGQAGPTGKPALVMTTLPYSAAASCMSCCRPKGVWCTGFRRTQLQEGRKQEDTSDQAAAAVRTGPVPTAQLLSVSRSRITPRPPPCAAPPAVGVPRQNGQQRRPLRAVGQAAGSTWVGQGREGRAVMRGCHWRVWGGGWRDPAAMGWEGARPCPNSDC